MPCGRWGYLATARGHVGGFGVLNPPPQAPRGATFGVLRRPRPSENCQKTARKPPETTTLFFVPFLAVFWRIWGPKSASGGAPWRRFRRVQAPETIRKLPKNRQKTARNYRPVLCAISGGFLADLGSPFRHRWRPGGTSFDLVWRPRPSKTARKPPGNRQ